MISQYSRLEARLLELLARSEIPEPDFNDAAVEIHRFQRAHNRPYDNYCRHAGVVSGPDEWRAIPAVPQSAFKLFPLRSFPENLTTTTFRTSGTTGEGFGEHYFLSTRLYDEAILRGWDFFGLPRLSQFILAPSPAQAPHSSLSHMMGVLRARARDGVQHFCIAEGGALEVGELRRELDGEGKRDRDVQPALLMGTALAFLRWFEHGEKIQLPPGSFALETGGYKGSGRSITKPDLYAMFGEHLGLAPEYILNEYGMTELSSQFYTRGLGNLHQGPPWVRALVVNPATGSEVAPGETGVLRIFDLANLGSVIALQTQDLAVRRENGFELLGRDPSALPRGCSRAADEMISRED